MRLLLDTNVFLEVILEQKQDRTARELFSKTEQHEFFISDYSLHSIGLLLFRRKQHHVFKQFLADMITNAGVKLIALMSEDVEKVVDVAQKYNLDFDDAYQYALAEQFGLTIVSFDSDFDRTEKGRKSPAEIKA